MIPGSTILDGIRQLARGYVMDSQARLGVDPGRCGPALSSSARYPVRGGLRPRFGLRLLGVTGDHGVPVAVKDMRLSTAD